MSEEPASAKPDEVIVALLGDVIFNPEQGIHFWISVCLRS
jgi:hypothetical protein